ncbi:MAG: glycerol kinase GlpK [Candidatus Didemnitutus sp.]|nr:glycerol kinase GlpK [Candidatus Didemnitutus sp.]
MPFVLAVDQSTSATKAMLFATDGRLLDRESRDHVQHYPQPGWVEHDAEEIWQNVLAVVRALLARHEREIADIIGLSLTNQRETVVVFDRATGRPLHRAIVWQCRRSEPLCACAVAAGHEELVQSRTGLRIDPYFSASKLQWLVREHPELRAKLERGEALIGTIDAYLIHRLTGGAVFATDHTNASRTLLFDVRRLRWDEELCALWDVPTRALPEVRESFAPFGTTTLAGALPRPVPICGVMGDSQAALFAHGCFARGSAKVTLGTGSSVLLNLGGEFRRSSQGVVTALAWVRDGVPVYAFEGIVIAAASTLTWLRDQLKLIDSLDGVEAMAAELSDNGGVHLVPAFSGLGLPYWKADARATIVGLTAHSDRRHVVRAAQESIAFQLRDALAALRADAALDISAIHADGGPTRNGFLMQFTADITGAELRLAPFAECSAFGAVTAGLLGLGVVSSLEALAALPRAGRVYRPTMETARVADLVRGWRHAVQQTILAREP